MTIKGAIGNNEILTKTTSGLSQPLFMRFFCTYQKVLARHFYDELRERNTIPFYGNTLRRLVAVSEACHLCFYRVTLSKLKPQGGHYA